MCIIGEDSIKWKRRVKNIGWQKNKCSIYVGEALHQSAISMKSRSCGHK